ncbi:MAG: DUF5330 domain-containing protein [Hyphomicrobiaceae bacterium]|nr:DUF5330 domain-containing protein [Hyphomicrobiaceae bacterium]MCC0010283.1 DUF5330 domain-containing protein [Hyphomicrobiaceae bacterium]
MLSFRSVVLLGAAIYLLPKDPARQQQLESAIHNAYNYSTTVCDRQPEACAKAGEIYEDLKAKAIFGAGLIYTIAVGQGEPNGSPADHGYTGKPAKTAPPPTLRWDGTPRRQTTAWQGTLTSSDLSPDWRGNH